GEDLGIVILLRGRTFANNFNQRIEPQIVPEPQFGPGVSRMAGRFCKEEAMRSSSILRSAVIVAMFALPFGSTGLAVAQDQATGAATAARGTAIQVPLSKVSNPVGRLANA